jgi:CTP-dependent riboflavin kinase
VKRLTLTGTVQDGKNDANRWLRRFAAVYESWLGQPIYPGSLNLDTGRPFDWHAPELLPHRRRFSLVPHGGERDLFMVPARIVRPGEQRCWLWTTTTAAEYRDDPNVVELIAPVRLRDSLGLTTGSQVEIIYPETRTGPGDPAA